MTNTNNLNVINTMEIIKTTNILSKEKLMSIWIEMWPYKVRNHKEELILVIKTSLMNHLSLETNNILELFKL
jgi:hypothetical protein